MFDEDILGIHEGNDNGEILGSKKRKLGDNTEERVSGVSKGMEKSTKVKNIDSLAEKKNGLVVTKGKKEDGGIKKRKVMLSVEDGNSGEKKDMRKKSGLVKL